MVLPTPAILPTPVRRRAREAPYPVCGAGRGGSGVGDTEDVEDELNIPFMMSGKGNTGAEITGMRDDGNDYFTFPLGATS